MIYLNIHNFFYFYVFVGILIYGTGILIFDKELINEIKNLKSAKQNVVDEK